MKTRLKTLVLLLAAIGTAPLMEAQQTLHNFSAFLAPDQTFFLGDWALTEPSGDPNPTASFSQGAGFYDFSGGSNADTAGAFHFFTASPGDLTGSSFLEVSARILAGNTAPTFTVSLFDSLGESAFAVFSTAGFSGAGFTTVSAALTFSGGFDPAGVASFLISGGTLGGDDLLNFSIDHLAATTAIPEPATYAAWAAAAVLAAAMRRRRAACAS